MNFASGFMLVMDVRVNWCSFQAAMLEAVPDAELEAAFGRQVIL